MKKIIPVIALAVLLFSCSQPAKNDKKEANPERTIDQQWLDSVIKKADSSYMRIYKRDDFATALFYANYKDSSVCQVMKDNAGRIRQVIIARKNTRVYFAQYYANGQLQADLPLDEFGQYHGNATYYYDNGMVQSSGVYKNGLKNGEWKSYDTRGELVSREEYDQNGQMVKSISRSKP